MPFGLNATEKGVVPTGMVPVTALLPTSITDTVLPPELPTYAVAPFGLNAADLGALPTGMVPVTALVATSITDTVLLPGLAT